MTTYQYMSFCGADGGDKFSGACVVEANNPEEAIHVSHKLGINPGGEVLSITVTQHEFDGLGMDLNRFYKPAEIMSRDDFRHVEI